jgi:guanylate kinase
MAKAEQELGTAGRFDVILKNEHLEETLLEAEKIVEEYLQIQTAK